MTDADADAEKARQEAERQAIKQMMAAIYERLNAMRGAAPAATDAAHQWVKEQCTDARLKVEFKRQVLEAARALDCEANMRATDAALADAARLAAEERMTERAAKLSEARALYGKACTLGANDQFRRATGRLIETIMMTGGVRKSGPTRAKPTDVAPANPRNAKP